MPNNSQFKRNWDTSLQIWSCDLLNNSWELCPWATTGFILSPDWLVHIGFKKKKGKEEKGIYIKIVLPSQCICIYPALYQTRLVGEKRPQAIDIHLRPEGRKNVSHSVCECSVFSVIVLSQVAVFSESNYSLSPLDHKNHWLNNTVYEGAKTIGEKCFTV